MFVKAINIAKKAMFPIFRFEKVDEKEVKVFVVGSGFFINRSGYFVSVAHVFDNPNPQTSFQYFGRIPDKLENPPLLIKEIGRNDEYDVFLGKVATKSPDYFYLAKQQPEIGKSVCISGYPLAQIANDSHGALELIGVRRYFQPSFVLDYITCKNRSMQGRERTHDGILVRDLGLYGMSGGPVFDIRGVVVGMQGSVATRVSKGGGEQIPIQNAIAIRSELILDILEQNRIRYNFLGNF